ncbi:MAG: S-layer homology domain-containing protein [Chloroflexi bacterium]|nr:S-layer homology domain-containing protein [Chloroflexota bacterium]
MERKFSKLSFYASAFLFLAIVLNLAMPKQVARAAGINFYVSPAGSDANDCLSPASACLTIQAAINKAGDGDIILVAAGIYRENVIVTRSLTISGDRGSTTVAGPGPGAPILDGDLDNNGAADIGDGFTIANGVDNVTIEGFIVRNLASSAIGIGVGVVSWNPSSNDNIIVRDNQFLNCEYAGVLAGNEGQSLHGNWDISYNDVQLPAVGAYGLELTNAQNSIIANNIVTGGENGIFLTAQGDLVFTTSNNTVQNNTVSESSWANIAVTAFSYIPGGAGPSITNVTITGNNLTNSYSSTSLSGSGKNISAYLNSSGTITNFTITNNQLNVTLGTGAVSGAAVYLSNIGNSAFSGNTYTVTGVMSPSFTFRAVDIFGAGTGAWTLNNNILGGAGAGTIGFRLRSTIPAATVVTLTNNQVTGFDTGIAVEGTDSAATGSCNQISGNTAGLTNSTVSTVLNFERNWWGAVSGPSGAGSGSGDTVGANVDFSPWSVDTSCTIFASANLTLTASGAATVKPGDQYNYTFDYTVSATTLNTQVAFALPGHTTFVSNTGGFTCTPAAGIVTCDLGTVSANGSFTATILVDKLKKIGTPLTLAAADYSITATDAVLTNGLMAVTADTLTPFADVPVGYTTIDYIQSIWAYGITSGCTNVPLNYCPEKNITRGEMSAYIERGIHTGAFVPPVVTLTYSDTSTSIFKYFIENLKADGITKGCSNLDPSLYCPGDPIKRSQTAVFLLRGKYWPAVHVPPAATGLVFTDVPASSFAASWIEELKALGITSGCTPTTFCPDNLVTRAQMAVLVQRTFNLPMPTP